MEDCLGCKMRNGTKCIICQLEDAQKDGDSHAPEKKRTHNKKKADLVLDISSDDFDLSENDSRSDKLFNVAAKK